jgi:hypothetical protein
MINKMVVLSLAGACLVNMACSSAPKPPMLDGGETAHVVVAEHLTLLAR